MRSGYFIELLNASGETVLRFGPVDARGADGALLDARLEVADNASGVRVVVNAVDPVYPIDIAATLAARVVRKEPVEAKEAPPVIAEIVGVPVTLQAGITETVDQIMERERILPPRPDLPLHETHHELEKKAKTKRWTWSQTPNAPPPMSHWPPIPAAAEASAPAPRFRVPQTVGTSFKLVGSSESGFIPPDSMGDVGPTQILVHVNGRIKVFDKTGVARAPERDRFRLLGVGNVGLISDPRFATTASPGAGSSLAITLEDSNNKIVIAVSSGPTITGAGELHVLPFPFNIGTAAPATPRTSATTPSLGVDANALYIGCNMFNATGPSIRARSWSGSRASRAAGRSSSPASASSAAHRPPDRTRRAASTTTIRRRPRGTSSARIPAFLNRLNIRRISTPGGTPTISGPNFTLAISDTNTWTRPRSGSTTDINSSDYRLFSRLPSTRTRSRACPRCWTAHSVETDTTCTPAGAGTAAASARGGTRSANL